MVIAALVADPDQTTVHSLRRLLVFCRAGRPALVLDGQQRITSSTLLLAALRDAAAAAGLAAHAASIAALLDGALQPTLDDRADFHAAVTPGGVGSGGGGGGAIFCCRAYFDSQVAAVIAAAGAGAPAALGALCDAAVGRLQFLHFGVENGASLQRLYETAATRDRAMALHRLRQARDFAEEEGLDPDEALGDKAVLALWVAAHPAKAADVAGVRMSPVDLLRNFVHEHFEGEGEQRRVHETLWMPMERHCGGTVDGLEAGFGAALSLLNPGGGATASRPAAAAALPDGRVRGTTGGAKKYGRMPHPSKMIAAQAAAAAAEGDGGDSGHVAKKVAVEDLYGTFTAWWSGAATRILDPETGMRGLPEAKVRAFASAIAKSVQVTD